MLRALPAIQKFKPAFKFRTDVSGILDAGADKIHELHEQCGGAPNWIKAIADWRKFDALDY